MTGMQEGRGQVIQSIDELILQGIWVEAPFKRLALPLFMSLSFVLVPLGTLTKP